MRMTMTTLSYLASQREREREKKIDEEKKGERITWAVGGCRLHSCHLCRAFSRSVTFTHETRAHEPNNRINSKQLVDLMRQILLLSTRERNRLSPGDGKNDNRRAQNYLKRGE